ncbi:hypothetical protein CDAR_487771 [Caerostris darwini]|uniref:Uncharacterized protein n=1 Tax=Caerostris darwini TaxID=1538125 RepID=A0AAV4PUX5_9ARAC|nr:hypothetical protein CDAR_487771 [Caerostris darwini]
MNHLHFAQDFQEYDQRVINSSGRKAFPPPLLSFLLEILVVLSSPTTPTPFHYKHCRTKTVDWQRGGEEGCWEDIGVGMELVFEEKRTSRERKKLILSHAWGNRIPPSKIIK